MRPPAAAGAQASLSLRLVRAAARGGLAPGRRRPRRRPGSQWPQCRQWARRRPGRSDADHDVAAPGPGRPAGGPAGGPAGVKLELSKATVATASDSEPTARLSHGARVSHRDS
jgi:hypothetical protein